MLSCAKGYHSLYQKALDGFIGVKL
jgi:serine/threonine protein kinase